MLTVSCIVESIDCESLIEDMGVGMGLIGPLVCVVWCTPVVRRIVLQCVQTASLFKLIVAVVVLVATTRPDPPGPMYSTLGVRAT